MRCTSPRTALTGSKRPPEGCLGALEAGACASVDAYQRATKRVTSSLRHGDYSSADARRARACARRAGRSPHPPCSAWQAADALSAPLRVCGGRKGCCKSVSRANLCFPRFGALRCVAPHERPPAAAVPAQRRAYTAGMPYRPDTGAYARRGGARDGTERQVATFADAPPVGYAARHRERPRAASAPQMRRQRPRGASEAMEASEAPLSRGPALTAAICKVLHRHAHWEGALPDLWARREAPRATVGDFDGEQGRDEARAGPSRGEGQEQAVLPAWWAAGVGQAVDVAEAEAPRRGSGVPWPHACSSRSRHTPARAGASAADLALVEQSHQRQPRPAGTSRAGHQLGGGAGGRQGPRPCVRARVGDGEREVVRGRERSLDSARCKDNHSTEQTVSINVSHVSSEEPSSAPSPRARWRPGDVQRRASATVAHHEGHVGRPRAVSADARLAGRRGASAAPSRRAANGRPASTAAPRAHHGFGTRASASLQGAGDAEMPAEESVESSWESEDSSEASCASESAFLRAMRRGWPLMDDREGDSRGNSVQEAVRRHRQRGTRQRVLVRSKSPRRARRLLGGSPVVLLSHVASHLPAETLGRGGKACLGGRWITKLDWQAIDQSEHVLWLATAHTVYLSHNSLRSLEGVTVFASAEAITLAHNCLGDLDHALRCLQHCPALRSLTLTGNPCLGEGGPAVAARVAAALPALEMLDGRRLPRANAARREMLRHARCKRPPTPPRRRHRAVGLTRCGRAAVSQPRFCVVDIENQMH